MRCKYDESHGEFANPPALRKHYDAEHADVFVPSESANKWSRVKGRCSECGTELRQGGFATSHRRRFHNDDRSVTFIPDGSATPRVNRIVPHGNLSGFCRTCGGPCKRKNIVRHMLDVHRTTIEHGNPGAYWSAEPVDGQLPLPVTVSAGLRRIVEPEPEPELSELDPHVTADDIVLPVIEGMAAPGRMVPVVHLAALFAWRDATADMLRRVRGEA